MRQERELMDDLLITEKALSTLYTTAVTEAATPNVRNQFKSVLTCELDFQDEVYQSMATRGWYQPANAEQQKIQQALTQHAQKPLNS
ncbi:spore coat protein [Vallitalea okinawensis]|uniref:spore coat protein n=1 Tax=Vallitalea okinawensis TaxID=2078660 RepID=UPI000CFC2644|nr:spore coat protein [Vallitalea okinawensis]